MCRPAGIQLRTGVIFFHASTVGRVHVSRQSETRVLALHDPGRPKVSNIPFTGIQLRTQALSMLLDMWKCLGVLTWLHTGSA